MEKERPPEQERDPIAIVSMSCRFPGAADTDAYWQLLRNLVCARREVPSERWSARQYHDSDPEKPGHMVTTAGSFLDDVYGFDAQFFGVSPREALSMDPQQRLLLEATGDALDLAGETKKRLALSRVGVFVGVMNNDYAKRYVSHDDLSAADAYHLTGNWYSFLPGRIAYTFGIRGPVLAVDAACASSLVAVHLACQSIRRQECDLAIAGGVSLILSPELHIVLSRTGTLAPDGLSKAFDASADGLGRGEGVGVIVLQRLSSALRDGKHIHAVIRGSAMNHGGRSGGFTVPSGRAQEELLQQALDDANCEASDIDYVEAHGTGTRLGDPIEARALGAVFGKRERPLYIGSVKTNIGHLDSAAGMAGLMKVALGLENRQVPPQLHFVTPNPEVPWKDVKLSVATDLMDWQPGPSGVRRSGVSAFGMSGINAHVILEEAPRGRANRSIPARQGTWLVPISAESEAALRKAVSQFSALLKRGDGPHLADVAYTAALRRNHYKLRLAVVAESGAGAAAQLEGWLANGRAEAVSHGDASTGDFQQVAFCFCGQGAQWAGMGARLLEDSGAFRQAIIECEEALEPHVDFHLRDVLCSSDESLLEATAIAQPSIFAVQVGLARLWKSHGVAPAAVMGHSVGEIAAAHIAGYLSLPDAARLVAHRGRLMQRFAGRGAMTLLRCSREVLAAKLAAYTGLEIAAENNPDGTVVCGPAGVLAQFESRCIADGMQVRRLKVDYAFHHSQLEQIRGEFLEAVAGVRSQAGMIDLVSSVTGDLLDADELNAEYWFRNLREPVLFGRATRTLLDDGIRGFVEIGPHPVLGMDIARSAEFAAVQAVAVSSMTRGQGGLGQLLRSTARLFTLGLEPDWSVLQSPDAELVRLPTYPYERTRFEHRHTPSAVHRDPSAHPLLGPGFELAGKGGERVWQRDVALSSDAFLEQHKVGDGIVLPGSAYLRLFLAAAKQLGGGRLALDDVEFREALLIGTEAVALQTRASRGANGAVEFTSSSRQARSAVGTERPWVLHALAKMRGTQPNHGPDAHSGFAVLRTMSGRLRLQRVKARCAQSSQGEHYAHMRALGMNYGPLFRRVVGVWRSETEALVELHAQQDAATSTEGRQIALLDACLQAAAVMIPRAGAGVYLPADIGSVHAFTEELPDECFCHAEVASEQAGRQVVVNLSVLAPDGLSLLELRAVRLVAIDHAARLRSAALGYRVEWVPGPAIEASRQPLGDSVVVFDDGEGCGQGLRQELDRQGVRVITVEPGSKFEVLGPRRYAIGPTNLDCFNALFARESDALRSPIVHLWNLRNSADDVVSKAAVGTASVLLLLQARLLSGAPVSTPLWVATRGAQPLDAPGVPSRAFQSPAWGLLRSARLELPQLRAASVDLDPTWDLDRAAKALVSELAHAAEEPEVVLRESGRLAPRLRRAPLTNEGATRARGTYVITGGLGGIGLEIAKSLSDDGVDALALLGRSRPSEAQLIQLAAIAQRGVRIEHYQVDVCDLAAVEGVLNEVERTLGTIRGVVHAAGVLDDGALMRLDWERLWKVLSPKVSGAWNLHLLTRTRELDRFVLFSSVSSLLGNAGQANYAAANAFLDALAEQRKRSGLPGMAINWGAWRDVGMLATAGGRAENLARQGLSSMSSEEAIAAFRQALGASESRLALMRFSPEDWIAADHHDRGSFLSELVSSKPTPERKRVRRDVERLAPPRALALVQQHLTRMLAEVTQLEVARLEPHLPFDKFGLDSIMGVEFKNRIDAAFETELSVSALWSYPRIDALARHVTELLGVDLSQATVNATRVSDAKALQSIADLLPIAEAVELN